MAETETDAGGTGDPDYDALARAGELPTFGPTPVKLAAPPGLFDRATLDELRRAWDEAEVRWLDDSVPDGSPEERRLKAEMDGRIRAFSGVFLSTVPAGVRLEFPGDSPGEVCRDYWHNGDGRLQSCRTFRSTRG